MILYLFFSYSGKDFASLTTSQKLRDVIGSGILFASEGVSEHASAFSIYIVSSSLSSFDSELHSPQSISSNQCIYRIPCYFSHLFPSSVPSVLCLPWFHLCKSRNHLSILPRPPIPCFHCLQISFIDLSLTSMSLLRHAIFLCHLLIFLYWITEVMFLKSILQEFLAPFLYYLR